MNLSCTPNSFLCPLTFTPSLRIYSNIPLNSHHLKNRKLIQKAHHHKTKKSQSSHLLEGFFFLLPDTRISTQCNLARVMRWARCSPGPGSSFFIHNIPVTRRLLSCSPTKRCEQGAKSCCLDVAAVTASVAQDGKAENQTVQHSNLTFQGEKWKGRGTGKESFTVS